MAQVAPGGEALSAARASVAHRAAGQETGNVVEGVLTERPNKRRPFYARLTCASNHASCTEQHVVRFAPSTILYVDCDWGSAARWRMYGERAWTRVAERYCAVFVIYTKDVALHLLDCVLPVATVYHLREAHHLIRQNAHTTHGVESLVPESETNYHRGFTPKALAPRSSDTLSTQTHTQP